MASVGRDRAPTVLKKSIHEVPTMTLFELGILLTTAGVSGVGCAALCGAVLDRIGRVTTPQTVAVGRPLQTR